jgi:HPr kinase/phosphorylase
VEPLPQRVHGSLCAVAQVGVLLMGRSGIGKSECALELVMRGHRLVADDVVVVERGPGRGLEGSSDDLIRHYMELRGIGIIHLPSLFGAESVVDRHSVDLVVLLETWGSVEVERVGMEMEKVSLCGLEVPAIHLPVAPGRNLASLVEVAARNHLLRRQGRSPAADLDARVMAKLRAGGD